MDLKESIINVSKYNLKIVVGNICGFDRDCEFQNHTRCSEDNKCVCEKNYIKIGLSCRPLIGSSCQKTEDCFPENSVCVNHICECEKDFVPQSYERCAPTYFNWKCNPGDEVCQEAQFFSCTDGGKCFCPPNYIVLNTKCVPLLNEHCTENKHCHIDFSACVNNKCRCKPEYAAQANNLCLPSMTFILRFI
ncbi:prion-like-(Q/N-rich) domain-bearing protein 25 [Cotesia glomerata]|uniref:prion-like-(Q/N-rich) domain-bearing protein 25 n=1 Tax=Cotesia glomerata TaxID=32391 RepID=UPI001D033000|nr:prion-like-(Q/N-rich) domain-bearing protein 25 [Cotesia glomerata]